MRNIMVFWLLAVALGMVACSDDDSTSTNVVPYPQTVMISISGTDVTNGTIGPGMGSSTRYLAYPSRLEPGLSVRMQFRGPSMMNPGSAIMMYDDGTHGDRMAGDGEYCYEDVNGMPGIHMMNAMGGHYAFEFYCLNSQGNHSLHQNAMVDIR